MCLRGHKFVVLPISCFSLSAEALAGHDNQGKCNGATDRSHANGHDSLWSAVQAVEVVRNCHLTSGPGSSTIKRVGLVDEVSHVHGDGGVHLSHYGLSSVTVDEEVVSFGKT